MPSPVYSCPEPGCFKKFKRSDRLLRHQKNHQNVVPYPCTWPGCAKSFVRKDVRQKHLRRHSVKEKKGREVKFFEIYTPSRPCAGPNGAGTGPGSSTGATGTSIHETSSQNPVQNGPSGPGPGSSTTGPNSTANGPSSTANGTGFTPNGPTSGPGPVTGTGFSPVFTNGPGSGSEFSANGPSFTTNGSMNGANGSNLSANGEFTAMDGPMDGPNFSDNGPMDGPVPGPGGPGDADGLIAWLLDTTTSAHHLDYSPTSSFKDLLGTPDFISSTSQSEVSPETIANLVSLVPALGGSAHFSGPHIERYLDRFWAVYHRQYPIIHRPTFSTQHAHPLLLLSMIAMGASLESRSSPRSSGPRAGASGPISTTSGARSSTSGPSHGPISRHGSTGSISTGPGTGPGPSGPEATAQLAVDIAQPLRWLICSHCEDLTTVRAWAIQSLLVLECWELTCSDRRFHRRANLHHGFKIELLRRSPLLGGDPRPTRPSSPETLGPDGPSADLDGAGLVQAGELGPGGAGLGQGTGPSSGELGPAGEPGELWADMIELESLKRCAFTAFLVDTHNAIIFGHDIILYAHHIKLSVPVSDRLWESASVDKDGFNTPKFLEVITTMLRRQAGAMGGLTRELVLGGLVSLVFQTESAASVPGASQGRAGHHRGASTGASTGASQGGWRAELLATLDYWYDTGPGPGASQGQGQHDSTYGQHDSTYGQGHSTYGQGHSSYGQGHGSSYGSDDTSWQSHSASSVYHLAQAFLRLSQYDCILYAGAPTRMNVRANSSDHHVVAHRVQQWAHSPDGKLSVVHAYVLLCDVLLRGDTGQDGAGPGPGPVPYEPNTDPVFYRPNIVASALFLVWDYNYCLYGPEANYYDVPSLSAVSGIASGGLPERMNGYTYLQRVARAFSRAGSAGREAGPRASTTGPSSRPSSGELGPGGSREPGSSKFLAYAQALDQISNKHHTVGLLRLLKDRYAQCNSQVCREYGRLMEHCIQRSLGKRGGVCTNMYD